MPAGPYRKPFRNTPTESPRKAGVDNLNLASRCICFGEITSADRHDKLLAPFIQAGAICDAASRHPLRSWGSPAPAKSGARLGGNMTSPCDEGDATGRGQPVMPTFDSLEAAIDIALKDFGGVRSKYPKVPRTTRRAGKRFCHGEGVVARITDQELVMWVWAG